MIFGVCAAIALVAAVCSVFQIRLLPPSIEKRELQVGVASTNAMIDFRSGYDRTPIDGLGTYNELEALVERAGPLAKLFSSSAVLDRIGRRLGVDPEQISATTQVTESAPRALIEPDSERRAAELLASDDPYRIEVQAQPSLPVLAINTQAPTADEARRLADTSVDALNAYLRRVDGAEGVPRADVVHLTQLGAARGGPIDSTAPVKIAGITFMVVFGLSCGLFALGAAIRRGWRSSASKATGAGGEKAESPKPAPARPRPVRLERVPGDDWPHTTRLLPWLIAGFVAMLFLIPFNEVTLEASLPVDLNLDRLVLPVIVVAWIVALTAGGPGAPRWRITPIHAGLAVFALVAGLSVVLNADELNRTLALDLSVKKLTLLAAYVSLFVVVASAVRPTEVPAFLKYILLLSIVCAVGVIWEYRTGYNVFHDLTAKVLSGIFEVPEFTSAFDNLGRRDVIGPAQLGLEAVAILSMAFPIAIVGLMLAKRWRDRILYGLAAGVLVVAMLSTYRKSALLAPVTVGLALAYFRPREALKLAPVVAVVIVVMAIASFSAFQSITGQFQTEHLDVATVSDRVSDYDAVRPDFLSHPAFGRGYGSYEHTFAPADNRILDSDLLLRVIETGVIGLFTFVLMVGTVIAVAAGVARGRDPERGPPAIAIGAAAAAFLCLSALFDEFSFPHAVYVFLTLAGLLAAIVRSGERSAAVVRSARGSSSADLVGLPSLVEPVPRRPMTPVGVASGDDRD